MGTSGRSGTGAGGDSRVLARCRPRRDLPSNPRFVVHSRCRVQSFWWVWVLCGRVSPPAAAWPNHHHSGALALLAELLSHPRTRRACWHSTRPASPSSDDLATDLASW